MGEKKHKEPHEIFKAYEFLSFFSFCFFAYFKFLTFGCKLKLRILFAYRCARVRYLIDIKSYTLFLSDMAKQHPFLYPFLSLFYFCGKIRLSSCKDEVCVNHHISLVSLVMSSYI